MSESGFVRGAKIVVPVMGLIFMLAFSLVWWSIYTSHQQACQARNATANLFHDILVLATEPAPGSKPLSPEQIRFQDAFLEASNARIDLTRC